MRTLWPVSLHLHCRHLGINALHTYNFGVWKEDFITHFVLRVCSERPALASGGTKHSKNNLRASICTQLHTNQSIALY